VSSDLLAFTDGQRCLALLRALERSHPVEKVRLQVNARLRQKKAHICINTLSLRGLSVQTWLLFVL